MMSDILREICEEKQRHIATRKQTVPVAELEAMGREVTPPRGFAQALRTAASQQRPGLIAEIKKASPSGGVIRPDFDPEALARAYHAGGATCLSVLTDRPYFQGEDAYLGLARNACVLPVLRKDFMLDPYQIIESRALGADCVLLIMAALSDDQAGELHMIASQLGMDVLVEVHDAAELERALPLNPTLLGINNRNLKTMQVNLQTSLTLLPMVPLDAVAVCESGLKTHADIQKMQNGGIYAFLVGESLMRQHDVTAATQQLLGTA